MVLLYMFIMLTPIFKGSFKPWELINYEANEEEPDEPWFYIMIFLLMIPQVYILYWIIMTWDRLSMSPYRSLSRVKNGASYYPIQQPPGNCCRKFGRNIKSAFKALLGKCKDSTSRIKKITATKLDNAKNQALEDMKQTKQQATNQLKSQKYALPSTGNKGIEQIDFEDDSMATSGVGGGKGEGMKGLMGVQAPQSGLGAIADQTKNDMEQIGVEEFNAWKQEFEGL